MERNETTRGRSFHSKPFVSILTFPSKEKPTRTEKNYGRLRRNRVTRPENRGAVTWTASALDPELRFMPIVYGKRSLRAGGVIHPSGTFGESQEVMVSPSRLDDHSSQFYCISSISISRKIWSGSRSQPRLFPRTPPSQAMAVLRDPRRGRALWRLHTPIPMLAMPSHAIYTQTPMILQQMSQHSQCQ